MHSINWCIPDLYQVYTKYIQSESMKVLNYLDLRSVWILVCAVIVRVTFNLTFNLYHDVWLMSHWSSVYCHKHSNVRNQDMKEAEIKFGLLIAQFIIDLDEIFKPIILSNSKLIYDCVVCQIQPSSLVN